MLSLRLDEESKSREHRSTGGSVKDMHLLLDKSTGLGPLQVHCLALYSINIVIRVNRIL